MTWRSLVILCAVGLTTVIAAAGSREPSKPGAATAADDGPAYVAYYWRVRPGKLEEYNAYIKGTAERIDEDARKAGVFIEVTTVLATQNPDGTRPDWTHLRMFKLRNMAAARRARRGAAQGQQRPVGGDARSGTARGVDDAQVRAVVSFARETRAVAREAGSMTRPSR